MYAHKSRHERVPPKLTVGISITGRSALPCMRHLGDHRAAQIVQNVAVVHILLVQEVGVALLRRLLALLALGGRGGGRREGGDLDDKVALAAGGGGGISGDFVDRAARTAAQLASHAPGFGRWADEDAGGAAAGRGAFRLGHCVICGESE